MSDRSRRRPRRTPNSKWAAWWAGLAPGPKAGMIISGLLLAPALCCAGALAAVASTDPRNPESDVPTTPIVVTSPAKPPERPPTPASTAASTPPPSSAAPPSAPSTRVDVRIVTVDEVMPYVERTIDDPSRPAGQRTVTKQGKPGKKARTFEVTYTDGRETGRRLVRETVVTPPTDHVISVGSAVVPPPDDPDPGGCDPNYSGCVPIASDVDCAGGSGNGPAYVDGPVDVIGTDVYDLDRDSDGVGCE